MIFNTLKFIYQHPFNRNNKLRALIRFFKWQINCRLNPYPVIYPLTDNSKIVVWRGLTGATGNLYCGLMDYQEMTFLLHFLRPDDLFIDVGANVGVYSILASAEAGAKSMAFEPIPLTFGHLKDNININQLSNLVMAKNIALGGEKGVLKFTKTLDTTNHVVSKDEVDSLEIETNTLDNILGNECPILIKIDVEGFESEVIRGARKTLENEKLKSIIIELNGSGARYGFDEEQIHNDLLALNFKPIQYDPELRQCKWSSHRGSRNTIYIRDEDFINQRLQSAKSVKIGNSHSI